MQKKLIFPCFVFIFALIFTVRAHAEIDAAADFDDASAIVVMRPENAVTRMFSQDLPFAGVGVSEVKTVCNMPDGGISTFSVSSGKRRVLELTFTEKGRQNVLNKIDLLNSLPEVEYAEPNYIYTLFDAPNDPDYTAGKQYALDKIKAPDVWDMNINCSDVTVAVVDSGVMMTHPDLKNNIWTNPGETEGDDSDHNSYLNDIHGWDFYDDDNDPSDELGHGTHVAGIISAETNNGVGVASLARNVKIIPLKIFNAEGKTTSRLLIAASEAQAQRLY